MAIQSEVFSTSFGIRSFSSTKHIATKQHMAVWLKRISDGVWTQLSVNKFELINNSAVLTEIPSSILYSQVEIRVADEPDELGASQSEIALVASISDKIEDIYDTLPAIQNLNDISAELINVSGFIISGTKAIPTLLVFEFKSISIFSILLYDDEFLTIIMSLELAINLVPPFDEPLIFIALSPFSVENGITIPFL